MFICNILLIAWAGRVRRKDLKFQINYQKLKSGLIYYPKIGKVKSPTLNVLFFSLEAAVRDIIC